MIKNFLLKIAEKTYTSIPALLFRLDQGRDILVEPKIFKSSYQYYDRGKPFVCLPILGYRLQSKFQQFSSLKLHKWGHTSLDWLDVKNWWTAKARSLTTSIGVLSTSISQVSGNSSIFPTYFWIISTHKSRSVPCLVLTLKVGKSQKVIFIFVPSSKNAPNHGCIKFSLPLVLVF